MMIMEGRFMELIKGKMKSEKIFNKVKNLTKVFKTNKKYELISN